MINNNHLELYGNNHLKVLKEAIFSIRNIKINN